MVANRLSRTGSEWTSIVSWHNSGTYNNQWMVVDFNRIQEDGTLQDGTLWVYEQLPGCNLILFIFILKHCCR